MNPQNQSMQASNQLPPVSGQDDVPVPIALSPVNELPGATNSGVEHTAYPQPSAPVNAGQANPQPTKSPHAPQIADDNDLIEKEWVNKAKLIVAKTKDDPREQSKELYKYKADYIKKRYNKDIKVSEA